MEGSSSTYRPRKAEPICDANRIRCFHRPTKCRTRATAKIFKADAVQESKPLIDFFKMRAEISRCFASGFCKAPNHSPAARIENSQTSLIFFWPF